MTRRTIEPHPGEILAGEYLDPHGLTAHDVARAIDVPPNRITELIRGNRGVTPDTAHRLARFFGTSPEYWAGLQSAHDLSVAAIENDYTEIKKGV